ncbi:MAG TPA: hypothetical protein VF523_07095 [Burkholderiales bacterium]
MGLAFDESEARLAAGYVVSVQSRAIRDTAVAASWREAEAIMRDPHAGAHWQDREEAERQRLMRKMQQQLAPHVLLDALTSAVEGHAQATYACAMRASAGDEALARVASGAALTSIHLRALALLAGCGELHVFVQKYALFAAGRFPLGMSGSTFIIF